MPCHALRHLMVQLASRLAISHKTKSLIFLRSGRLHQFANGLHEREDFIITLGESLNLLRWSKTVTTFQG